MKKLKEKYDEFKSESIDFEGLVPEITEYIEALEKINSKMKNCLIRNLKDMDNIDSVCDEAKFHRFTLMRKELENVIKEATE